MGKTDVVKLLLDKGASTDLKDGRGDTALNYAVMTSNIDEVRSCCWSAAPASIFRRRAVCRR
jgi:ankyrin repeat protein